MHSFIKAFKKHFLKFLTLSIFMLLIAAPFGWLQVNHPHQFQSLTSTLEHHPTSFLMFRWLMIALFVGSWPYFIKQKAKKQQWSLEKTQFWLSRRLQIGAWLVLLELLVCENLLLTLIKAL